MKIGRHNMAWQWNWPSLCDGTTITILAVSAWVTLKGDHPGFGVHLCICNVFLLDFGWHSDQHAEDKA
jgi:hypothetical protein